MVAVGEVVWRKSIDILVYFCSRVRLHETLIAEKLLLVFEARCQKSRFWKTRKTWDDDLCRSEARHRDQKSCS